MAVPVGSGELVRVAVAAAVPEGVPVGDSECEHVEVPVRVPVWVSEGVHVSVAIAVSVADVVGTGDAVMLDVGVSPTLCVDVEDTVIEAEGEAEPEGVTVPVAETEAVGESVPVVVADAVGAGVLEGEGHVPAPAKPVEGSALSTPAPSSQ